MAVLAQLLLLLLRQSRRCCCRRRRRRRRRCQCLLWLLNCLAMLLLAVLQRTRSDPGLMQLTVRACGISLA